MKIVLLLMLVVSNLAVASEYKWDGVEQGERYKLNQDIKLQLSDDTIKIKKGSNLRLIETTDLNMIKVKLQRFKMLDCNRRNLETDLELVNIEQKQTDEISVGVNVSKGCILEVFVEKKDINSDSFLL